MAEKMGHFLEKWLKKSPLSRKTTLFFGIMMKKTRYFSGKANFGCITVPDFFYICNRNGPKRPGHIRGMAAARHFSPSQYS